MRNRIPMSSDLLELLCIQAKAGRMINLPLAGIIATFDQAMTILDELKGTAGGLYLSQEGFDSRELGMLALSGCTWCPEERKAEIKALNGDVEIALHSKADLWTGSV